MSLPKGVERVTSVEGFTEYRLVNGLRVLLFPDQSKQTVTMNVTYLVGSRHENYGETGMAHLLEKKIAALTPDEIAAAMRRHIDPSKLTIIKAGDFAKAGAKPETKQN